MDGFNFTDQMWTAVKALSDGIEELSHVLMDQVAVSFVQTRKAVAHGMQASLTPMRFEDGQETSWLDGRLRRCERLIDARGIEVLYLMHFYVPRFMNLSYLEKLSTIVHELWHISPAFDGDLRRHPGRCYMHTESEKEYDAKMDHLVQRWLCHADDSATWFLRHDFVELRQLYGPIYGTRIAHPKLRS